MTVKNIKLCVSICTNCIRGMSHRALYCPVFLPYLFIFLCHTRLSSLLYLLQVNTKIEKLLFLSIVSVMEKKYYLFFLFIFNRKNVSQVIKKKKKKKKMLRKICIPLNTVFSAFGGVTRAAEGRMVKYHNSPFKAEIERSQQTYVYLWLISFSH